MYITKQTQLTASKDSKLNARLAFINIQTEQ